MSREHNRLKLNHLLFNQMVGPFRKISRVKIAARLDISWLQSPGYGVSGIGDDLFQPVGGQVGEINRRMNDDLNGTGG